MGPLEIILVIAIVLQVLFTLQVISNNHYARKKSKRKRESFRPQCTLIVPCKGLDEEFDKNIESFFRQNYQDYSLYFVVQDASDTAYDRLSDLLDKYGPVSCAQDIKILIAGPLETCSQKLHNLLFAYRRIPENTEVLVFADSDACAGPNWLAHLVHPLRRDKNGAASGYRCFIPKDNSVASIALTSLNAKICQMLGNTPFNLAWGGSMAISVKNFRDFGIEQIWQKALSDDLSLSRAVRRHHRKMVFVPACMIASFQKTTWAELWEFARRQFIITRVYSPGMWIFGLLNTMFSVVALWGSLVIALMAFREQWQYYYYYLIPPVLFGGLQACRAILRQNLIRTLLEKHEKEMRCTRYADILFFWAWSILLLLIIISSGVGKTITWRNIRYRLNSPLDIQVLDS